MLVAWWRISCPLERALNRLWGALSLIGTTIKLEILFAAPKNTGFGRS